MKSNEFRADNLFNEKYKGTQVNWDGIFIQRLQIRRQEMILEGYSIKMEPTDSQDYDLLLLPSLSSSEPDKIFSAMEVGDRFKFTA